MGLTPQLTDSVSFPGIVGLVYFVTRQETAMDTWGE